MTAHEINKPTEGELEWVNGNLGRAWEMVVALGVTGVPNALEAPPPLPALDAAYELWRQRDEAERYPAPQVMNALGLALGQHLVNVGPFEWGVVGRDLVVHSHGKVVARPVELVTQMNASPQPGLIIGLMASVMKQAFPS
jgi:hypothetical protein